MRTERFLITRQVMTGPVEEWEVEVCCDMERIAKVLGRRAVGSKGRKSKEASGMVVAKAIRRVK